MLSFTTRLSVGLRGMWRAHGARAGWTGLLLVGVFAVLVWAQAGQGRWDRLGVAPMPSLFADWAAVLAAGEAWAAGADPWAVPNPYDPYGRPHVYGPGWLVSGSLGLDGSDTWWTGALLVVLFVGVVARVLEVGNWRSALGLGLALMSAPMLLAFNRANNDLAVFLLIVAAGWAAGRSEPAARWFVVVGLVTAALLKFYPAVALLAIAATGGSWRERIGRATVAVGVAAVLVIGQWEVIRRSLEVVPSQRSWWAYDGRAALELLWGMILGAGRPIMILGVCAAVIPLLVATRLAAREWWRFLSEQGRRSFWVVASAMCWVGCLFAGPSYIYRAIWLLPVFGLFLRDEKIPLRARIATGLLGGLFLVISTLKHADLLSYHGQGRRGEVMRVLFFLGAEQVLLLATGLVCGVMLAGWAWRCGAQIRRTAAVGREF